MSLLTNKSIPNWIIWLIIAILIYYVYESNTHKGRVNRTKDLFKSIKGASSLKLEFNKNKNLIVLTGISDNNTPIIINL